MNTFTESGLSQPLLAALKDAGYEKPTEIQAQTIGLGLKGQDIIASAQTGSGKTAAFALPIINRLSSKKGVTRALVIVPTRELAVQVMQQFKMFGKYLSLKTVVLYGGVSLDRQQKDLEKGADIIVGTPGRLNDCIQRGWVKLNQVDTLVLDEADRLMDMGFMPQVRKIINALSRNRQTLLFSATIDGRIESIAREFMQNHVVIKTTSTQVEPVEIEQSMIQVHEFDKDDVLKKMVGEIEGSLIVFTGTRRKVTWIVDRLADAGVTAEELHGDISQKERERAIKKFKDGSSRILVATDVAARGLDIPSISHVINYDVPQSAEDYVHRIGRTGRAGRSGKAITFVSQDDWYLVRDIEKLVGKNLDPRPKLPKPPMLRRFGSRGRR